VQGQHIYALSFPLHREQSWGAEAKAEPASLVETAIKML